MGDQIVFYIQPNFVRQKKPPMPEKEVISSRLSQPNQSLRSRVGKGAKRGQQMIRFIEFEIRNEPNKAPVCVGVLHLAIGFLTV